MEVLIQLERVQPPAGTVRLMPETERPALVTDDVFPFVGWLGLLSALGELVRAAGDSAVD